MQPASTQGPPPHPSNSPLGAGTPLNPGVPPQEVGGSEESASPVTDASNGQASSPPPAAATSPFPTNRLYGVIIKAFPSKNQGRQGQQTKTNHILIKQILMSSSRSTQEHTFLKENAPPSLVVGLNVSFSPSGRQKTFGRDGESFETAQDVCSFTREQAEYATTLSGIIKLPTKRPQSRHSTTAALLLDLSLFGGPKLTLRGTQINFPPSGPGRNGTEVRLSTYLDCEAQLRGTHIVLDLIKLATRCSNQLHPDYLHRLLERDPTDSGPERFLIGGLHTPIGPGDTLRHVTLPDIVHHPDGNALLDRVPLGPIIDSFKKSQTQSPQGRVVYILPAGRTAADWHTDINAYMDSVDDSENTKVILINTVHQEATRDTLLSYHGLSFLENQRYAHNHCNEISLFHHPVTTFLQDSTGFVAAGRFRIAWFHYSPSRTVSPPGAAESGIAHELVRRCTQYVVAPLALPSSAASRDLLRRMTPLLPEHNTVKSGPTRGLLLTFGRGKRQREAVYELISRLAGPSLRSANHHVPDHRFEGLYVSADQDVDWSSICKLINASRDLHVNCMELAKFISPEAFNLHIGDSGQVNPKILRQIFGKDTQSMINGPRSIRLAPKPGTRKEDILDAMRAYNAQCRDAQSTYRGQAVFTALADHATLTWLVARSIPNDSFAWRMDPRFPAAIREDPDGFLTVILDGAHMATSPEEATAACEALGIATDLATSQDVKWFQYSAGWGIQLLLPKSLATVHRPHGAAAPPDPERHPNILANLATTAPFTGKADSTPKEALERASKANAAMQRAQTRREQALHASTIVYHRRRRPRSRTSCPCRHSALGTHKLRIQLQHRSYGPRLAVVTGRHSVPPDPARPGPPSRTHYAGDGPSPPRRQCAAGSRPGPPDRVGDDRTTLLPPHRQTTHQPCQQQPHQQQRLQQRQQPGWPPP